jgi:hypothetical protein
MGSFDSPAGIATFPTSDIKLAAAMRVMGFPYAPGMPGTRELRKGQQKEKFQWWFEREIKWGDPLEPGQGQLTGPLMEYHWNHKEEFARDHPDHPITWMRQALDARGWLYAVKHGEKQLEEIVDAPLTTFKTNDIHFASCLVAARYVVTKLDGWNWTFFDDGQISALFRQFREPFDPENPLVHLPVTWRREVLLARDEAATIMADPRNIPMIHDWNKGRPIILSAYASRETKFAIFSR